MSNIFNMFVGRLSMCLLWNSVSSDPMPIFKLGCLVFCFWNVWALCIFWILTPYRINDMQISSHIGRFSCCVGSFLCCAEAFWIYTGEFVYLCFRFFRLRKYIQKHSKTDVREHTAHICAPGGHRDAYFSLNKCITGEKPKATSHIQGTGLAFERLWSLWFLKVPSSRGQHPGSKEKGRTACRIREKFCKPHIWEEIRDFRVYKELLQLNEK